MKPTTEHFLIPIADALSRVCPSGEPQAHHIAAAAQLRVKIAFEAKNAHDAECQRLADKWVEQNKTEFLAKYESYRKWAVEGRYPHTHTSKDFLEYLDSEKNRMWSKILPTADPIFRDYISETPPTA